MTTIFPPGRAPATRVPVEQRLLGVDRRQLIPAAVVLAIGLVWSVGLPWIDRAVSWNDPIVAGDVIDLGQGATLTPPVGWQLTDGVRVGDVPDSGPPGAGTSATVTDGGTTISATQGVFSGDVDSLLSEAEKNLAVHDRGVRVTGDRAVVTTDSGLVGTSEPFTSPSGDGVLAAFVLPTAPGRAADGRVDGEPATAPTAVTFAARSRTGQSSADADEIQATLRSLTSGGSR